MILLKLSRVTAPSTFHDDVQKVNFFAQAIGLLKESFFYIFFLHDMQKLESWAKSLLLSYIRVIKLHTLRHWNFGLKSWFAYFFTNEKKTANKLFSSKFHCRKLSFSLSSDWKCYSCLENNLMLSFITISLSPPGMI